MALFDIYIDEVDDILEIRRIAIEQMKAGGTVLTSWSSENTSVTKTQGMSLSKILEETRFYLQQYDPDLYGRRITRTRPGYLL
jgi:hypothetical protein